MLSTDIKYMPRVSFVNMAKLLFASNHAIISNIKDDAFLRRLVVVPFLYSVPVAKQDRSLGERIAEERDSIIVKALQYYVGLRSRNYQFSGDFSANMAVDRYDDSMDCIFSFLRGDCIEEKHGWVSTQALYDRFALRFGTRWTPNIFSERINRILPNIFQGVEKKRGRVDGIGNPIGGFCGITLKNIGSMEV